MTSNLSWNYLKNCLKIWLSIFLPEIISDQWQRLQMVWIYHIPSLTNLRKSLEVSGLPLMIIFRRLYLLILTLNQASPSISTAAKKIC